MIRFRMMAICFVTCTMLAPAEASAQDEADQLRAIERARLRSLVEADLPTARRLHADEFELINPVGGTLTKEKYLGDIASGALDYLEWEPEEIRVKLYGQSALIRYKARLRISVNGNPSRQGTVTFWHTDLYEKRDGQWQIVWSHATQIQPR
ncbi:MAG TPA: nuclear transport factor 2 family protein [Gemmatimonadaceae bacterium]|nr:nuclear transport factor 2 family protein [Gemmatimonadaceae bacterium]